jgi:hypothetical protein
MMRGRPLSIQQQRNGDAKRIRNLRCRGHLDGSPMVDQPIPSLACYSGIVTEILLAFPGLIDHVQKFHSIDVNHHIYPLWL